MEYNTLDPGQIRLILLKPGKKEDIVELSLLQNIQFDTVPLYYGLSYTWGDMNDTKAILINNRNVLVTKSLAICLWHLRQTRAKHTPIRMWIDAICINQEDNEEKSVQILLMRKIYEQATSTIVWLGPESVNTQAALNLMNNWWDYERAGRRADFITWLQDEKNADCIKGSWLACASFGSREWFSRIWIVQEVAVSTNTVTYCGIRTLSLEFIERSLRALAPLNPIRKLQDEIYVSLQNPEYPRLYQTFRTMSLSTYQLGHILDEHTRRAQGHGYGTLFELLWKHRNAGATNPRDKVYALLGLLDGTGDIEGGRSGHRYSEQLLVVDYNASIRKVFESVVKAVVSATSKLNILYASQYEMCQEDIKPENLRLPSWVPDWSQKWIEQDLI